MTLTSFGAAANQEASNTVKRHGFIVVGIDAQDKPFTEYENIRHDVKQCLQITLGVDSNGKHVVADIEQSGKAVAAAWSGIKDLALPEAVKSEMAAGLTNPSKIEFAGLEFAVGGPATGTVVDRDKFDQPENQAVLTETGKNYSAATYITTSFVTPHQTTAPAASAKLAR